MSTTPTTPVLTAPTRLAPGALRANVAAFLITAPGDAFTVTQVARALSASGGAVGNALMSLASGGYATQTLDTPRTFTANAQTSLAAASAVAPVAINPVPRTPRKPAASAPALASALTAAPGDPAAPVARPNGTLYRPRALAGLSDVAALRAARNAEAPVLLYGPPGTGKTSLIEAAFPDVVTVTADPELAVSDLVHRAELHRMRYSSPVNPCADVQDQGIGCGPSVPVGARFEPVRNQFNDVALYATWRELLISRARRTCCSLTRSSTWTRRRRCSTR